MVPTVTEEQKQQLQQTTLTEGENAWDYIQSQSEEDRPWVIAGILSCIEHGYGLTELEINWQARNLRRELTYYQLFGLRIDIISIGNRFQVNYPV